MSYAGGDRAKGIKQRFRHLEGVDKLMNGEIMAEKVVQ